MLVSVCFIYVMAALVRAMSRIVAPVAALLPQYVLVLWRLALCHGLPSLARVRRSLVALSASCLPVLQPSHTPVTFAVLVLASVVCFLVCRGLSPRPCLLGSVHRVCGTAWPTCERPALGSCTVSGAQTWLPRLISRPASTFWRRSWLHVWFLLGHLA